MKILIVVLVVTSIGVVAYQQRFHSNSDGAVNTETSNYSYSGPEATEINTDTAVAKQNTDKDLVLDLSGQDLTRVPMDVFDQTSIETLDLSHNKLTGSLQAEIRFLQNLKVLDLSHNQFTGVPAEIGQLKYLEVLNLANNRLTGLPLELGNLNNLKILSLQGNDYSRYDLELIKEKLPAATVVEVE